MGSRWKVHHFTERSYVTQNGTVWFHSACNLSAAATPTGKSTIKRDPVNCLRCLTALEKAKNGSGSKVEA